MGERITVTRYSKATFGDGCAVIMLSDSGVGFPVDRRSIDSMCSLLDELGFEVYVPELGSSWARAVEALNA